MRPSPADRIALAVFVLCLLWSRDLKLSLSLAEFARRAVPTIQTLVRDLAEIWRTRRAVMKAAGEAPEGASTPKLDRDALAYPREPEPLDSRPLTNRPRD